MDSTSRKKVNIIRKKAKKCFKLFDNSGYPIQIKYKGDGSYTTLTGGIIYLIYLVIAIPYIMYNFYFFVSRKNSTLIFTTKRAGTTAEISLSQNNFNFSVGLSAEDPKLDEKVRSYLTVEYKHVKYESFADLGNQTLIESAACRQDNFNRIDQKYYSILEKTFCPKMSSIPILKGNFIDEKTDILTINVKLNENKTIEDLKYDIGNNKIWIFFYFMNVVVDHENYADPIGMQLDFTFGFLDIRSHQLLEFDLSPLKFISDNNILWPNPQDKSGLTLNDKIQLAVPYDPIQKYFFTIALRSSYTYIIYERTYQKLTDFLAGMTGILSQVIILVFIISNYLNEKSFYKKIVNESINFVNNKNFDFDLFEKLFHNKNNTYINNRTILNLSKENNDYELHHLDSHRKVKQISEKSLNSKNLFVCNKTKAVALNEKKVVDYYLDILTIMKKFEELEVLKTLSFSMDQLELFNFISQPKNVENKICNINYHRPEIESIFLSRQKLNTERNINQTSKNILNKFSTFIENSIINK